MSNWGSVGGSVIKNLPASAGDAGDRFDSRVRKDPLEEEMATHRSILAWKTLWTEEPGGLQSIGLKRGRHDLAPEHTIRS